MLIIDIILLILLLGFFIRGWQAGLIRMFAGLLGIFAGIVLSGHFYPLLSTLLQFLPFLSERENLANLLSLLIVFLSVVGLVGFGAYFVDKIFHIFSFLPFLKTLNRLAGAILGLLGGAFIFGFLILALDKFPLAEFITRYFENSAVVPYLILVANFILPLWPEAIKQIKGLFEI